MCDDAPWSMASQSGTTNLAIVAGAALGAVAALFAGRPKPDAPRSVTSVAVPEAPVPAASPAPAASASFEVWNADEDDPKITDAAIDPRAAELECSRGVARQCLLMATASEVVDAGRARLFENIAVAQWNQACTARDPEACHELAKLHERGIGVPVSAAHAKALRERTQELCRQKPSPFCNTLQTPAP
jgi:hypothetical protein